MSILQNFARWGRTLRGLGAGSRKRDTHCMAANLRVTRFEHLEVRNPLAADIHLGAVYFEPATGDDSVPNVIEVTFQGGAPGTQLTQIVIDGDKDGDGKYSSGEIFFDTAAGGKGAFGNAAFKVLQANGFTVGNVQVVDGGQKLVIDVSGFDSGEKLIFSLDVDEVQFVASNGSIDVNSLVEGNEFQRSILTGSFTAPHFHNISGSALFWDEFNQNFADANASSGSTLDLPNDNYQPPSTVDQTDLTAGAVLTLKQIPLPITLAGTVYHDKNLSNSLDGNEQGIANVTLNLLQFNGSTWVSTGISTTTDANGKYKFTGILPGEYRVAEVQPTGWLDVGSQVGTVNGSPDGTSINPNTLSNIILVGGQDGVQYNFGESLPASLSGKVWADPQGDCIYGPNDIPLLGVQIDLRNAQGVTIATTTTDAQGRYKFENLGPGTYSVFEHQPAGYYEGMDLLGTVDGATVGTHGAINLLSQILLGSGAAGINYDFCEELPASLSGKVWADPEGDCIYGPNDIPLSGVKIDLLNQQGQVVATTTTDSQGKYKFENLKPGTYTVFEHQPAGYYEGMDLLGTVEGIVVGVHGGTNLLSEIVLGSGDVGINYDFCEELPASLSGKVWADPEGDCVYGPNDIPLAGVQIDLLDANGVTVATTTTNSQGQYKFENLHSGTYSVFEHQPAGYYEGMDILGTVEGVAVGTHGGLNLLSEIYLGSGDVGINYDFCEELPASISGKVWADPQGDCVFGPNDIALAGVQIDLINSQGNVVATTTTNAQGQYKFENLHSGTYSVFEHQPAGYYEGMDILGTVGGVSVGSHGGLNLLSQIVLGSGDVGINYDFCEELPASISGKVWADPQGDCIYGPNDLPLAGIQIDLLDANGNVVATTATNAQGQYKFENLKPGTYGVFEHQPAGYYEGMDMLGTVGGIIVGTHGGLNLLDEITLGSGANGINYDFCEELPASISGKVWADPQGDCVYGPNDIPLAGVQIDLLDSNGNLVATTTTNAQGQYSFQNLQPGTYRVFEHQPIGYYQGMDMPGTVDGITVGIHGGLNLLSEIVLGSSDAGINYDFCEEIPASVSGKVWNDTDGDCIYDPTDIPLSGVQIDLLNSTGQVIATTTTDANGHYQFVNLQPGTYSVFEHQPAGFLEGMDILGTVGGVTVGTHVIQNTLSQIVLGSGDAGIDYDFCEELPAKISGKVWNDTNGDCVYQPTDIPLSGVKIDLLNAQGQVIATTTTDANGNYKFENLKPGTYSVFEHQPTGFLEGMDMVGTVGGVIVGTHGGTNLLSQILLGPGTSGINYDFCEQLPASISGKVWNDTNGDCIYQPSDTPLGGVQIDLRNAQGQVIATTFTDVSGNYKFDNLLPGQYSVFEHQPKGLFQGMDMVGTISGIIVGQHGGENLLSEITLGSGANGINYDFCEISPASISGYVFQDGPPIVVFPGQDRPDPESVRDGKRTSDDTPISGAVLLLYHGDGTPVVDAQGQQLRAVTNSKGFYKFSGLAAGKYVVREVQPGDYIDSIDTPGTTGGVAQNRNNGGALPALPFNPNHDVIAEITLNHGQNSRENNFSEVVYGTPPLVFQPQVQPVVPPPLQPGIPFEYPKLFIPPYTPLPYKPPLDGSDAIGYTWHLSIVDAGYPRGEQAQYVAMNFAAASGTGMDWSNMPITRGEWILQNADGTQERRDAIGLRNAIPLSGDFNGDGVTELGLYVDGQWFIDLNGDGKWDASDLWAKLGTRDDKPVVGDWNGDGKDDIGIYGPAWPRDPSAVRAEPGLPDPSNKTAGKRKKNIPPTEEDAALGHRRMQLGQQGKMREELIDHVFHYGTAIERPIVGDWTGSGLRRIGVYRDGSWYLDIDGDGRWTDSDLSCHFGQAGDIPVIGDWNGDGVENIGVYRNGTWHLDTNGNHQLDASDRTVQLGQPGDLPVVGDFNGTGRAEIGVYRAEAGGASAAVAELPADEAPARE